MLDLLQEDSVSHDLHFAHQECGSICEPLFVGAEAICLLETFSVQSKDYTKMIHEYRLQEYKNK